MSPEQALRVANGSRFGALGAAAVMAAVTVGALAGCASRNGSTSAPGTAASVITSAAAGSATASSGPGSSSATGAAADVRIAGCEKGVFDAPVAHLVVTNSTSVAHSYVVKVAFDSPDGTTQYDTAFASVDTLAPGQSSPNDAGSLKAIDKAFSCKVVNVTRNPS